MANMKKTSNRSAVAGRKSKPLTAKQRRALYNLDKQAVEERYSRTDLYLTIEPEEFNMEYYKANGLDKPIIFNCDVEKLGMRMVGSAFQLRQIVDLVGSDRQLTVTNENNGDVHLSLEMFIKYMENKRSRKGVLNSIALEFSNTGLADLVCAPALVRQLDWGLCWPDAERQRTVLFNDDGTHTMINHYPRVEHFCLISSEGSWTDFHIDLGGTSVWYHVARGEKVIWIIPPTAENLKKFETWNNGDHDGTFLGDIVDDCFRVTLLPGNTLILPSGWIHAVLTPADSLVFGGNFLHVRAVSMQIRAREMEERGNVDDEQMYPLFEQTILYYLADLVKRITGREYVRPTPRRVANGGPEAFFNIEYVGEDFIKTGRHRTIPTMNRFDARSGHVKDRLSEDPVYTNYQSEERRLLKGRDPQRRAKFEAEKEGFVLSAKYFFHPSKMSMDDRKWTPRAPQTSATGLQMEVNEEILQSTITSADIPELERLIDYLRSKKKITLPKGITKPDSLLACVEELLRRRAAMGNEMDSDTASTSFFPEPAKELKKEGKKRKASDNEENWAHELEKEDQEDADQAGPAVVPARQPILIPGSPSMTGFQFWQEVHAESVKSTLSKGGNASIEAVTRIWTERYAKLSCKQRSHWRKHAKEGCKCAPDAHSTRCYCCCEGCSVGTGE